MSHLVQFIPTILALDRVYFQNIILKSDGSPSFWASKIIYIASASTINLLWAIGQLWGASMLYYYVSYLIIVEPINLSYTRTI
ncbi:hypothetical protein FGO68_gene1513 [Halteria grandinella]|uniref:Uncharacterized protein n=1 Tax=Halteria grandinella TaxID=5974 RepID=A0A8J8NJ51_HALGN|nr:hypothetical protein FGO68_gene1513 [Halteria grandinella]